MRGLEAHSDWHIVVSLHTLADLTATPEDIDLSCATVRVMEDISCSCGSLPNVRLASSNAWPQLPSASSGASCFPAVPAALEDRLHGVTVGRLSGRGIFFLGGSVSL